MWARHDLDSPRLGSDLRLSRLPAEHSMPEPSHYAIAGCTCASDENVLTG